MLLGFLSAVLVIGFWMFVLSPARKAATEAEAELSTARTSLAAAQAKLTAGRAAQQAFRRDRTTIVKLGRTVPETDDIPTLLTQLQALAKREHVMFNSYEIQTTAAASATGASASATSTTVTQTGAAKEADADDSTDAVAPLYPPGSVEIAGGLGRTPIKIVLKGGYFELERYLRAVQRFAVLSAKEKSTKGRLLIVDGFTYKPTENVVTSLRLTKGELKSGKTKTFLEAELGASVYFAPPLELPSAASAATAGSSAATPASSTGTPTTTATGAAAIGGIR